MDWPPGMPGIPTPPPIIEEKGFAAEEEVAEAGAGAGAWVGEVRGAASVPTDGTERWTEATK